MVTQTMSGLEISVLHAISELLDFQKISDTHIIRTGRISKGATRYLLNIKTDRFTASMAPVTLMFTTVLARPFRRYQIYCL